MCSDFDDIRPYTDDEIPEAMKRIADWDMFPQIAIRKKKDKELELLVGRKLHFQPTHAFSPCGPLLVQPFLFKSEVLKCKQNSVRASFIN